MLKEDASPSRSEAHSSRIWIETTLFSLEAHRAACPSPSWHLEVFQATAPRRHFTSVIHDCRCPTLWEVAGGVESPTAQDLGTAHFTDPRGWGLGIPRRS